MSQLPNLAEKRPLKSKIGQSFSKPRSWSFAAKILAVGTVALALTTLAHAYYQQQVGNFHTVVEGEVYRAAQPSAQDVARYHREYGIRTILNLRGKQDASWFVNKENAANALGIQVVNFQMESDEGLTVAQAGELAKLMKDLPKPLLIHCEHGANRTGLASAIYVDEVAQAGKLAALAQLTPYYGHFPIPVIGKYRISESYWDYMDRNPT